MDKKQGWAEFMRRINEPPEMIDTLIRHKWPEEKPERDGVYLTFLVGEPLSGDYFYVINYTLGKWRKWWVMGWQGVENVAYWWELPEVRE